MVSNACIIAACAAHSRHNNDSFSTLSLNNPVYYRVTIRTILEFESFVYILTPDIVNELRYDGWVDMTTSSTTTVAIQPMSVGRDYMFFLSSDKCEDGPDKYMTKYIEEFKQSEIGKYQVDSIVKEYITTINSEYKVNVNKDIVRYKVRHSWEITV